MAVAAGDSGSLLRDRWVRLAFGLICGAIFLVLFIRSVDLAATLAIISGVSWAPLLVALFAYMLDFILRAVRFWMLIDNEDRRVPLTPTIAPFVASFGISDILPLRLGDIFRVYWFNRHFQLPVSKLLAAMILERLFDLLSIVLLAAVTIMTIEAAQDSRVLAAIQTVLVIAAVIGLAVMMSPRLLGYCGRKLSTFNGDIWRQASDFLLSLAAAIGSFWSVRRIIGYFTFSLAIWLLESVVVLGAWIGLGGSLEQLSQPFFAFTISTLGTLVPALPGHFGSYEFFGFLAFDAVGVEHSFAAAVILVAHLVLWLPTAIFGIIWLLSIGGIGSLRLSRAP